MTALLPELEAFHLLRPWWLLLAAAVAAIWVVTRLRAARAARAPDGLAPHLSAALTLDAGRGGRLLPVDLVAAGLILAALAAAGPTWSRQPDPFAAQTAPLAVALKVAPSMTAKDVAPDRLARAKQKIRDLLELRAGEGGRTALIAYAGSAHAVVPMTEDPQVTVPYLDALAPEVMPKEGDAPADALALAQRILSREDAARGADAPEDAAADPSAVPAQAEGGDAPAASPTASRGGVLFVLDAINAADVAALNAAPQGQAAVLALLPEGAAAPGLDALTLPVIRVTADDTDITALNRRLDAEWRRAQLAAGSQPWEDRGWWLAWPAALLALVWFRRGSTMRWALAAGLALSLGAPGESRAAGLADILLTPDQQGRLAYERRDYDRAAELFVDPEWKARALYRDGQYPAAAQIYARLETADAAFRQGLAHIKGREYREAVAAFETAVERDPDLPGAAENLATAKAVLEYIESTREQSDTGEDAGIGADDVVLDNKDARGADTQIEAKDEADEAPLSAEQWMRTVDTRPGDFLRQRFAVEAAQSE